MKMFMKRKIGMNIATIFTIVLVLNLLFGGICTKYCVNFYYNKYMQTDTGTGLTFFSFAIVGLFIGEVTIPVSVITYLIVRPLW